MNASRRILHGVALAVLLTSTYTASAFYDATRGRWINRDPIGEQSSLVQNRRPPATIPATIKRNEPNLYGFVRNHPPIAYDALGLQCCLTTIAPGTFPGDTSIFGHSILSCDNGAYISLWPTSQGGWHNQQQDDAVYANASKTTVCFPCLDESKVLQWYYNNYSDEWSYSYTCADAVMAAIQAGLPEDDPKPKCPKVSCELFMKGCQTYPRNVLEDLPNGTTPIVLMPSDLESRLQALKDNNCSRWKCTLKCAKF